jgi:TolB-like protein/Flp pilus assembly protein TadD
VNRGAQEDAYFAAGLTDEIQNRLTPVYGIALISRITADQYGESAKSPQQMREETGADYLLRGSIQWSQSEEREGRVKVMTQLVRTTDDRQIWSESYERGMAGVFEVQSDIAGSVIKQLDLAIAPKERDLMLQNPTSNPDAYQLFLNAQEKWRETLNRGSPLSGLDSVAALHRQATLLDTSFAQAYAGMAFVHSWAYHEGDRTPERLDSARRAMERALELDPDDPRTRITHAWYQYRMFRDYERALEECELAQEALPNAVLDVPAYIWRRQGKIHQAADQLKKRFELNPRDSELAGEIGGCYAYLRDYEKAFSWYDRALTLAPENMYVRMWKAKMMAISTGRTDQARLILKTVSKDTPPRGWIWLFVLELDRDFEGYIGMADSMTTPIVYLNEGLIQRDLALARGNYFMGNQTTSVNHADDAVKALQAELDLRPADARIHLAIGCAHALRGDRTAAIEAGKRALDLAPVSWDALIGTGVLRQYAEIAAIAGDQDEAIRALEELTTTPAGGWSISTPCLEAEPVWDGLKQNPRFKSLLAE